MRVKNIPTREEIDRLPYIIAVDFDGTLVEFTYRGIGNPKWEVIDWVKQLVKTKDAKLILWTCRSDDNEDQELTAAVNFCREVIDMNFDAVNCNLEEVIALYGDSRKIHADLYIDDKGGFYSEASCEH